MNFLKSKVLLTSAAMALTLAACGEKPAEKSEAETTTSAFTKNAAQASVSEADLRRRIKTLASDEFEGRAPSSVKTQEYLAAEMEASGLVPMGVNGTYFQPVTLTEMTALESSFAYVKTADKVIDFNNGDNAVFWTKQYTEENSVTDSELVFVGYGVVAPEYGWDDYAGMDVEGKTVVMLVNDPGFGSKDPELFKGETMTYYGRWTYKFEEAARQGAAAAIVIHETAPASYPWEVVSGSWTGAQFDLVRPDKGMNRAEIESWVTYDQAVELFDLAGMDYEALKVEAHKPGFKPIAMEGLTLSGKIENEITTTESNNVAGGVVGSKYPDEYVLYMGHWDHLGTAPTFAGSDNIYNGAVDNATGTAAILEIGETFANAETPPERSVIIVAVTAEESGLLGSAYYAEDPLVPLDKTVAGINIDAILPVGDTKDIIVVGYGASELEDRLKTILDARGKYIVPDQNPAAGFFYRSDHISLAKKGVPMLYADSGIDHVEKGKAYGVRMTEEYTQRRYHKPADEYSDDWDVAGIVSTTEILHELGLNIANTEEWPNWYDGNEFRALRDEMLAE